jgi:DNA-binding NarL/FixJ family response regulator
MAVIDRPGPIPNWDRGAARGARADAGFLAMPDSPTLDERNLLQRMADGSTDESIARRLGISDRQVRRRIARLLQRLGVSSRFAAGAEAVRRGWL